MEIIDNKLIINTKKSEGITITGTLTNEELSLSDFNSLVCQLKEVKNIDSKPLYTPTVFVDNDDFIISIPSKIGEKLPSKCYLDLKGLIGDSAMILLEVEINIENNVTKIF